MPLRDRVLRTIQREGLARRGARVVAALSGGADSVALVELLRDLHASGDVVLAGLAHFNHQLRGHAADDDERFCRAVAAALELPIEVGRADVRALARESGRSVEDAARAVRYEFLERAADALGAERIAVAHTRDDQAETFLLRLLRGAGPRGLAGIRPRAGRVIRPLLDISRGEVRAFVTDRRLAFREDASNADVAIPRNRVRHELIPYLQREFSPGIVDVLAREAAVARLDEERLEAEAIDLASSVVLEKDGGLELGADALSGLPAALASRIVRHVLAQAAPGKYVGAEHIEQLLELARGRAGASLSLPGCTARRVGSRIVVGPTPPRPFENSFRVPLSIPGEVALPPQGWVVEAAWSEGDAGARDEGHASWTAPIQASAVVLPLAVRSRRPGDRFRPLGLGARKKLQDFLVDRKIPRERRDSLPLVVDGDDRIVWVVGQALAEDFRVTAPSQGVILLKARRLGGLG